MKKINSILKQVLEEIKPQKQELKIIKNSLNIFLKKLKTEIKKLNINASLFVGGSIAKNTLIKKDCYDADVFLRFDKKYTEKEISYLCKKIIKKLKNCSLIHGSRDYYKIDITKSFFIELIPVRRIAKPRESKNITDLSYSHVRYIKSKIKTQKQLDEILLIKAFCHANNSYGAESFINGFSGYALELLIYYYGSFLKLIRAVSKIKEKTIIDIEKDYKSKQYILMNLNKSKLGSPIILIDPTFKLRNVLAALSNETLNDFKKNCIKFLKKPSLENFKLKKFNLNKLKKQAKDNEFVIIKTKTNKQRGDIAGTKLLKFHKHLNNEISEFFKIKKKGFEYDNKKSAINFFIIKPKKQILIIGPNIKDKKNASSFKKKHKNTYVKKGKIYSEEKVKITLNKFLSNWKNKYKTKIKEMSIIGVEIQ
jgi:tRNA nucleotidyltransferase (CCA-adding enzyme)